MWTEEDLVPYLQDPNGYLREYLDSPRRPQRYGLRVRTEQEAMDLAAFLASVSPDAPEEESEGEGQLSLQPTDPHRTGPPPHRAALLSCQ